MKKEKVPKVKKEKKPKVKKEKKPKEKKQKDPNKKKSPLKLILLVVAIAAVGIAAFLFLSKKDEGEEEPELPELPATYQVGDQSILALIPGEGEEDSKILATQAKTVTVTYEGLKNAGAAAHNYVVELASQEQGYAVVGEDFVRIAPPEFDTPEGSIYMAKAVELPPAEDEEKDKGDGSQAGDSSQTADASQEEQLDRLLTVRITWSEGTCVVVADEAEGKIVTPPMAEDPVGGMPSGSGGGMTITSSTDYLYNMDPDKLGLPGSSMKDYQVIPMDGTRMVNGHMCYQMNVYSSNALGSNEFLGIYMMSLDGNYLYRWDMDTGKAILVER